MTLGGDYPPICCFCGSIATGRCAFMGRDNEVIDNPFCKHHETIVVKQTIFSLKILHATGMEREMIAMQKWVIHAHSPALPANKAEFYKIATTQYQAY
jgi:hypothetical protein